MITSEQRRELRAIINRPADPCRENRRAWIVLNRADGLSQTQAAAKVGVARPVVIKWEQRFRKTGLAGLADAKGRGRKPWLDPQVREKILVRATQPPANRLRWSVRTIAQSAGGSKATVQRLWSANNIKPHGVRTFKLSNLILQPPTGLWHSPCIGSAAQTFFLCAGAVWPLICAGHVRWCNGSTRVFGALCHGSNPCRTASFPVLPTPA